MKEYQSICKIANFVFGRRDVDEEEIYTFSYLPGAGFPYMFNVCCEWSCSSHCPTCLLEEVEEKLKNRHGVDIETDSVIVKDKSVLGIFELMEALENMSCCIRHMRLLFNAEATSAYVDVVLDDKLCPVQALIKEESGWLNDSVKEKLAPVIG